MSEKVEIPWVDWEGGDCPVSDNTPVEFKMRDTYLKDGKPRNFRVRTIRPQMLIWSHGHGLSDIIAYRLIAHPFAN